MELHEIVGTVLLVISLLYMIAFWGSALWRGVYYYLQDGDREMGDICGWIEGKFSSRTPDVIDYIFKGLLAPIIYIIFVSMLQYIIKVTGIFVPLLLGAILLVWLSLYILRGVIRLNKKLDKHSEDKNAHS